MGAADKRANFMNHYLQDSHLMPTHYNQSFDLNVCARCVCVAGKRAHPMSHCLQDDYFMRHDKQ